MAQCININHPDYIDLLQESGLHEDVLKAKISIWMEENGEDRIPALEELAISPLMPVTQERLSQIKDVFNENPNGNVEQFKSWVEEFNRSSIKLSSNIQIFSDNKQGNFDSSSLKDDDLALMLFNQALGLDLTSINELTWNNIKDNIFFEKEDGFLGVKNLAFTSGNLLSTKKATLNDFINQKGLFPEYKVFIGESVIYPNVFETLEENEIIKQAVFENLFNLSGAFEQVKKELNNHSPETFIIETPNGKFTFPKRFAAGFWNVASRVELLFNENQSTYIQDYLANKRKKEGVIKDGKEIKPVITQTLTVNDTIVQNAISLIGNSVIENAIKNNTSVKIQVFSNAEYSEDGVAGWYSPASNTIYLHESMLKPQHLSEGLPLIAHELIHSVTSQGLLYDENFSKSIRALLKITKDKSNIKDFYGFKNEHEFLSEAFSSQEFRQLLKDTQFSGTEKLSVWQKFVNAILELFGKNVKYTEKSITVTAEEILNDVINDNKHKIQYVKSIILDKFDTNKSLSDFISQKSQENNSFQQFQQSLNKPNTNPILQGNQQEQTKKFAELQERLNNKEFLEGAKNAFESSEELQNVYYEALGFDNNLPLPVNKEIEFLLHTEKLKINLQDITLEEEGNVDLNSKDKWNTFAIKAKGKKLGYIQVKYKDDNTVKIGLSALYEGKEEVKQSIISKILDIIKNIFKSKKVEIPDKKTNVNAGKGIGKISYELLAVKLKKEYQKELISDTTRSDYAENLWKSFEKQGKASVIGKTDTQYRWDYYYKFNVGNQVTPQQKQQALNAYTDYLARVSLGIIKNPSSGEYNYESQVKDIVYHGSPNKEIQSFLSPEKEGYQKQETTTTGVAGIYFSNKKEVADLYQDFKKEGIKGKTYSAVINTKRPLVVGDKATDGFTEGTFGVSALWNIQKGVLQGLRKAGIDAIKTGEYASKTSAVGENIEIAVFEPEQIHILGSKKDIEKFKNWIGINNVLPSQKLLDNLQFKKGDC